MKAEGGGGWCEELRKKEQNGPSLWGRTEPTCSDCGIMGSGPSGGAEVRQLGGHKLGPECLMGTGRDMAHGVAYDGR